MIRSGRSRAAATLDAALPGSGGDAAGLDHRLQAARAPREFAAASGALFAAVDARAGTHLVDLEYARGDRLRATGRFFLKLAPYWQPDLVRVAVTFDRPLGESSALTLCPKPEGDDS